MATVRPCLTSAHRACKAAPAMVRGNYKAASLAKLSSACHISSSAQIFQRSFMASSSVKFEKTVVKAMSEASENSHASGLPINLKGLIVFLLTFCTFLYQSMKID